MKQAYKLQLKGNLMILRILTTLLEEMHEKELLVLIHEHESTVNALIAKLAEELAQGASSAQQGAQFSSWLSSQILESDLVEELYASDAQIYELLSNISL